MEWRIRGDDMVARVTVLMLNNERCLQKDAKQFFLRLHLVGLSEHTSGSYRVCSQIKNLLKEEKRGN